MHASRVFTTEQGGSGRPDPGWIRDALANAPDRAIAADTMAGS
jgi:hypothetical protein